MSQKLRVVKTLATPVATRSSKKTFVWGTALAAPAGPKPMIPAKIPVSVELKLHSSGIPKKPFLVFMAARLTSAVGLPPMLTVSWYASPFQLPDPYVAELAPKSVAVEPGVYPVPAPPSMHSAQVLDATASDPEPVSTSSWNVWFPPMVTGAE